MVYTQRFSYVQSAEDIPGNVGRAGTQKDAETVKPIASERASITERASRDSSTHVHTYYYVHRVKTKQPFASQKLFG